MQQSACFAVAINCMDGRIQIPVIDYVKKRFHVRYVDMITEPGPVRILSEKRMQRNFNQLDEDLRSQHGNMVRNQSR